MCFPDQKKIVKQILVFNRQKCSGDFSKHITCLQELGYKLNMRRAIVLRRTSFLLRRGFQAER